MASPARANQMLSLPTLAPPGATGLKLYLAPCFGSENCGLELRDTFRVWELILRCPGQVRQWWPPELGGQGWLPLNKVENLSCASSG